MTYFKHVGNTNQTVDSYFNVSYFLIFNVSSFLIYKIYILYVQHKGIYNSNTVLLNCGSTELPTTQRGQHPWHSYSNLQYPVCALYLILSLPAYSLPKVHSEWRKDYAVLQTFTSTMPHTEYFLSPLWNVVYLYFFK